MHVAVTGADGCVGTALTGELVSQGVETTAFVHAADRSELERRAAGLRARLGAPRLRVLPLELPSGALGGVLQGLGADALVHAAGVTAFRVERELAQRVNVQGTQEVLGAARCSGLSHVVLLGSIYASGLSAGVVPEGALAPPAGFANFYEESKYDAELLALEARAQGEPVSLLRVATVLADSAAGGVSFPNAVHSTLRLLHRGLLPILPANPDTPLYLTTAEPVARGVLASLTQPPGVANLSPSLEEALSVGDLLDVALEVFGAEEGFARRRTPRPILSDLETFELFADAVDPLADHLVALALRSIRPFAPQLHIMKEVGTDRGAQLAAGLPLTRHTLSEVCAHLAARSLASTGGHRE